MIAHKKVFYAGFGLIVIFTIVLIILFMPVFGGQNALENLDMLYNSISKGSAYYIPKAKKEAKPFNGTQITVDLEFDNDDNQVKQIASLFEKGGATIQVSGANLKVSGDLGQILENSLIDADYMYHNDGKRVSDKYGIPEKQALYNWWNALKALDLALKKQKKFEVATVVDLIQKKAVETAYNYYGIEPQKITDRFGIVTFSLIFYVVYTLWYGFAIMYMFEGWGLRLEH
jgi:subtilase family serine protease